MSLLLSLFQVFLRCRVQDRSLFFIANFFKGGAFFSPTALFPIDRPTDGQEQAKKGPAKNDLNSYARSLYS